MSIETKRYRLLKDIQTMDLTAKAGDIGIQKPSEFYDESCKVWFDNGRYFYYLSQIKQYPEWFELIPEQSKELHKGSEEEKITDFDFNNGAIIPTETVKEWHNKAVQDIRDGNPYSTISSGRCMVFAKKIHYKHHHNPCIEVIEITNGYKKYQYENAKIKSEKVLSDKKYTQSEVDTIREDAFNAGGSTGSYGLFIPNRAISDTWSYPFYKDYLQSLSANFKRQSTPMKDEDVVCPPQTVTDNSDVACLSLNDLKNRLPAMFTAYLDELTSLQKEKLNYSTKPLSVIDEDAYKNRCNVCGDNLVYIRGKYPNTDKRTTCPTCTTERLEQINEVSNKDYGKSYQSKT